MRPTLLALGLCIGILGRSSEVTVRITFFNKVEDVHVPIDLTVGLGL